MLYTLIQVAVLVLFILLIWPHIKNEDWKEKFIENKHAKSLLIVFVLIILMAIGLGAFFEAFFPVERIDK